MNKWAQMRNGISGLVVAKFKREDTLILGLDLNGDRRTPGDVFYVNARECKAFDLPKPPVAQDEKATK